MHLKNHQSKAAFSEENLKGIQSLSGVSFHFI